MCLEKDSVFKTAMNICPNNRLRADRKSAARPSPCFLLPAM